jgi:putative Mg2+ transporter-C (MgtC) family protein
MQVDPESLSRSLAALLIAFAFAFPIAWNRERGRRRMGLRTFPLVSLASCGYVLIGLGITAGNPDALARIIQGLITGVGFIGGGAILKSREEVKGASTAAAIWATGAVGAAVATSQLALAVAIAFLTFLVFLVLTPVRKKIREGADDEDEDED